MKLPYPLFFLLLLFASCHNKPANPPAQQNEINTSVQKAEPAVVVGAARFGEYLPLLQNKRVAMAVNQTSVVGSTHLVDTLLAQGVQVVKVFAPEHGFRGEADAGAKIDDATDSRTGLPIVSLYGSNKKPTPAQLADVDVILFDIQDVGARFYTYISTMHYLMEAAAEQNKEMLVLDRPNPNGHYVDGPILEAEHTSFVGLHPIPIVHGLTVGELAKMINGEGWLEAGKTAQLTVVPVANYTHNTPYSLPIKPSPNLPNDLSVALYPSLCLFEGTLASVGRGTDWPFQVVGSPYHTEMRFTFTPQPKPGASKPLYSGQLCYGRDFRQGGKRFNSLFLSDVIDFYQQRPADKPFFKKMFTLLAGTEKLQQQIEQGLSEQEIVASWQPELNAYKQMREKYLLYAK